MTTTTLDSGTTELEDRLAIVELIGRVALTIDGRDWNALGQRFTDTVYHDRTSLTGGEPVTLGVADFVDGWRQKLQNMDPRRLADCRIDLHHSMGDWQHERPDPRDGGRAILTAHTSVGVA
jgi:SnoaL-like protein